MSIKKILLIIFSIILAFFTFYFFKIKNAGPLKNSFKIALYEDKYKEELLSLVNENFYWLVEGIEKEKYNFGEQLDKRCYINRRFNEEKPSNILVAISEENNDIAGFITFFKIDDEIMNIHLLCTKEKYRRMKVSQKLLTSAILKSFEDPKIKLVHLLARKDNIRAHNLYSKLGFRIYDDSDKTTNNYILKKESFIKD